ncbi:hypothetical protein ACIPSE_45945 [Streptomyces sp. NPDC090106]|uniref:hypothetical protein n=1 Tax=Streptomyces sp. NPDC090106 TaxID=3365946 RepID=UPI0037F9C1EA
MGKKTLNSAVQAAACVEHGGPWQRHRQRGVQVTVIVIEILRIVQDSVDWSNSLEGAMAVAVALAAIDLVCRAVRRIGSALAALMPERVVLTRQHGKLRSRYS